MCQDDNLQDSDDEQSESLELSRNINGDSLEEPSYLDSSETSEEKSNSRSGKKMLKDILVEQETKKVSQLPYNTSTIAQRCYKNSRMVGHKQRIVARHGLAAKKFNTEIALGLSLAPILNALSFYNMMKPISYILQKVEHARYVLFRVISIVAMQENL